MTTSTEVSTGGAAAGRSVPPRSRMRLFADLLYVLTWRDIRIRYKQSVMGFLWAIFMPALIVGAGVLVRVALGQLRAEQVSGADIAALAVKALPWAFFVSATRFGTMSLAGNVNLITKINIPRIVFPVSAVLSSLFDVVVALLPLAVILALCGVMPGWTALWALPLLAILVLQVSGVVILTAVGNLFMRDVKYIVEVVLTFAIFLTPVLYSVSMVGVHGHWVMLNPLAPILEGLEACVVRGNPPDLAWTAYSAAVGVVLFGVAWSLFNRLEGVFADYV